jgi:DNA invertase Pin-like site-specific DNA recombinase
MSTNDQMTPEEEEALSKLLAKKAQLKSSSVTTQPTAPAYVHIKTGYIYCRVSTEMQNESLHSQESQLRALAARENIQIINVYHEEDVGGASDINNRPQLRKIFDIATPGQYLILVSLDRVSRDKLSQVTIEYMIRDARIHLLTPTRNPNDPNVDTTDGIHYFIAQMELKKIRERISNAMSILSVEGNLRTVPYFGWKFVDKTSDWIEEEREQAIIKRIIDLYVNHKKCANAIATILNTVDKTYARQYTNKKGQIRYSKFYRNTVTNILIHAGIIKIETVEEAKKPHLRIRQN